MARIRRIVVAIVAVIAAALPATAAAFSSPSGLTAIPEGYAPPTQSVTITEAIGALNTQGATAELRRSGSAATLRVTLPDQTVVAPVTSPTVETVVVETALAAGVPLRETTRAATATPQAAPDFSGPPFSWTEWMQAWGGLILMALLVALIGMGILFMRGGRKFSKSTKPVESETRFDDVAGIDEIRDEVVEIADYLRDPERFLRVGATLPKGIVLYGPPGTGKTLLAKAVAGEAGVPFFSASGSEFIEVYVGVGARRIRDLFKAARKNAPALLYIDEIDAIGERRSGSTGGGEREHTATLDQLLSEMDGFDLDPAKPVVVLASTNRLEHLDPALVRSGRFDRKIAVGLPDRAARERILGVHMRTRPLAPGVALTDVAAFTAGMAGADLAALCNEASFEATRAHREQIGLDDFRRALLRLAAGPEKKTQVIAESERRLVAYHEMGHAIVGHLLPTCEPVERVTVIPQGQALGVTVSIADEDTFLATRQEYLDRLARTLGGRAAEEVVFGQMTSGAADDLAKATELARLMVEKLGMARETTEESLSVALASGEAHGEARRESEIRAILTDAYRAAREILIENEDLLHRASEELLEADALDREEIEQILGPRPEHSRLVPLPRGRTSPFPRRDTTRERIADEFGIGIDDVGMTSSPRGHDSSTTSPRDTAD